MEIKVVVFDDNKTRRTGLQLLINATEGMKCVGAFEDCSNVLTNIIVTHPDVVLMDIDMPNVNGIEGVKLIRKNYSDIKILMQTVFEEDEKIFASICAGADGYILKKASPAKLIESISDVMQGGAPMTPTVARQVLKLFGQQNKKPGNASFNLTERELEILSFLVKGLSYKMIAEQCSISYATVNTHIKHIYEKLQVHSVVEAVTKAIDQKIV
ncbi:MAG: response regulator [Bacteroidia bacterium]